MKFNKFFILSKKTHEADNINEIGQASIEALAEVKWGFAQVHKAMKTLHRTMRIIDNFPTMESG